MQAERSRWVRLGKDCQSGASQSCFGCRDRRLRATAERQWVQTRRRDLSIGGDIVWMFAPLIVYFKGVGTEQAG